MASATFFLALSKISRHPYLSARIATRTPTLKPGEVLMELDVEVPDALFRRPTLRASVKVPANVPAPEITTEVQDGIAAAVQAQLGLRVHVTTDQVGEE